MVLRGFPAASLTHRARDAEGSAGPKVTEKWCWHYKHLPTPPWERSISSRSAHPPFLKSATRQPHPRLLYKDICIS